MRLCETGNESPRQMLIHIHELVMAMGGTFLPLSCTIPCVRTGEVGWVKVAGRTEAALSPAPS